MKGINQVSQLPLTPGYYGFRCNGGLEQAGKVRGIFQFFINPNNPPKILTLGVVQADGKGDLNKEKWTSPDTDPFNFFYRVNGTVFEPSSFPASSWNDGCVSGLLLSDPKRIEKEKSMRKLSYDVKGRHISETFGLGFWNQCMYVPK